MALGFARKTSNNGVHEIFVTQKGTNKVYSEDMGRAKGIEPSASGTTNRCSTTELRSPSGSYKAKSIVGKFVRIAILIVTILAPDRFSF